jgi:hypothetical protein
LWFGEPGYIDDHEHGATTGITPDHRGFHYLGRHGEQHGGPAPTPAPAAAPRPFASYTAADHARAAMAFTAWTVLGDALDATVPTHTGTHVDEPGVLIAAALQVHAHAERLLQLAVTTSRLQGMGWPEIGDQLSVSRQAAWQRFDPTVKAFLDQLHRHLQAVADDPDAPIDRAAQPLLVNTGRAAPLVDAWRVEAGQMPGTLQPAATPGDLLQRLSPAPPPTPVSEVCGFTDYGMDEPDDPETTAAASHSCVLEPGHPGDHVVRAYGVPPAS